MTSPYLLISDLHLTDNPLEEYRWRVFEQTAQLCQKHSVKTIIILGDPWDRKDRHSAKLVNRTVNALVILREVTKCRIFILMGNHDELIGGGSFWTFLNHLDGIVYVTSPLSIDTNLWLLPFSSNPKQAWAELPLNGARALFIHQTVAGALIENDRVITTDSNPMPVLPAHTPVYSGDVHRPQQVGTITYVGCPYPVRFGEDWGGRALLLSDPENMAKYLAIPLETIRRSIIDLRSVDELEKHTFLDGLLMIVPEDQIRIRYHLTADQLTGWAYTETAIRAWAEKWKVNLLSIDPVLTTTMTEAQNTAVGQSVASLPPSEVVKLFCSEEQVGPDLTNYAQQLLSKVT